MNQLNITLAGLPFHHLLYHFVLTYSNWETVTICFSESFESLSHGLQNALWELGGSPRSHRTDRLTAAVNNLPNRALFQQRYQGLLAHYGLQAQAIAPRQAHQNGDVEQSHNRFKTAVGQALALRGSSDFPDRSAYEHFLRDLLRQRNSNRIPRFSEEQPKLRALPSQRLDSWQRRTLRVSQGSTISINNNLYSVPSQLIGMLVKVQITAEHVEVWLGSDLILRVPRQPGRNKHVINYRHIIDSLIRKPGAFVGYRHFDAMFPTSRFRRVYDLLVQRCPSRASKDYLRILELAAKQSQAGVDKVLHQLLDDGTPITPTVVEQHLRKELDLPEAIEVTISPVDLANYDLLLQVQEERPLEIS